MKIEKLSEKTKRGSAECRELTELNFPLCKDCGKEITGRLYPNGLCQGCYRYRIKGGKTQELPPPGVIQKDERGYVVCHICGKAYRRLGSHVRESHGLTTYEYKERFGLCNSSHTTEAEYAVKMHNYAIKNNMPQKLREAGTKTRIKSGDTHMRKNKKVRLQEIISKKYRTHK